MHRCSWRVQVRHDCRTIPHTGASMRAVQRARGVCTLGARITLQSLHPIKYRLWNICKQTTRQPTICVG